MATVSTVLKELRDAKVSFISLVDRSASRLPIRVIKRDKGEDTMDLTRIFKKDVTPEISAIVVHDSADVEVMEAVKTAIQKSGFSVEKARKSDDVLIYEQTDNQKDVQLVRLSDDVAIAVKGFMSISSDSFPEMVAANGFYSGLNTALDTVYSNICQILASSEDAKESSTKVNQVMSDASDYICALVKNLPMAAFKADIAVREALEEVKKSMKCPEGCSSAEWEKMSMAEKKAYMNKAKKEDAPVEETVEKTETPVETAETPVAETPVAETQAEEVVSKDDVHGLKPNGTSATEEETTEELKRKAKKQEEDMLTLLSAVQSIANKVDIVVTKVDGAVEQVEALKSQVTEVAASQEIQKKVVDDLVQKSDTLSSKLASTVIATPTAGDAPAQGTAKKSEEDSFGYLDTAMFKVKKRQSRA